VQPDVASEILVSVSPFARQPIGFVRLVQVYAAVGAMRMHNIHLAAANEISRAQTTKLNDGLKDGGCLTMALCVYSGKFTTAFYRRMARPFP
jgi:hypothetical protein